MSTQSFQKSIEEASANSRSKIILALDYSTQDRKELLSLSLKTLKAVAPHICAVKINRQLVLPLGLYGGVKRIVDLAHKMGLLTIMDCKINDVGHTNYEIAFHYYNAGFDALIASPFVGWEDGLEHVFKLARNSGKGVILLVYMSHKGATEGYGQKVLDSKTNKAVPQYLVFAKKALEWKADGVIVGATYPERILEVNTVLNGKVPIYSPGVGVQGGDVEAAIKAGSNYLIVGRSIILSDDPVKSAKEFQELSFRK